MRIPFVGIRRRGHCGAAIGVARPQDESKFPKRGATREFITRHAMHYAIKGNEISVFADTENLDAFMRVMESQATADAMAFDGVKRETVKIVVFDKEFKVSTGAASGA